MDALWWIAPSVAMAAAIGAIVFKSASSGRVRVLDADAARSALVNVLLDTPLTNSPDLLIGNARAARRITSYVRGERESIVQAPRPGGVQGWWSIDEAALRSLLNDAAFDCAAALAWPPERTVREVETERPWELLSAYPAEWAARLRELPTVQTLLRTRGLLAPDREPAAEGVLATETRNRIEALCAESTVIADQIDAYLSKRAQDDAWRLVISRAVARGRELSRLPQFRTALQWAEGALQRVRLSLENAGWSAAVSELRRVGVRILEASEQLTNWPQWLVDPAVFDAARNDVVQAREETRRLEAALDSEQSEFAMAWQQRLADAQARSTNARSQYEDAVRDIEALVSPLLRAQAEIDSEATALLLEEAASHIGNPRFGRGRRRVEDWHKRAALAASGTPHDVLLCVVSVPGGAAMVRDWLSNRVASRAAMLQATALVLDEIREAAVGFQAQVMIDLLQQYGQLEREAETRLAEIREPVELRLRDLRLHLERLEAWATGGAS